MARITGVGGVFFKSKGDSAALAAWYRKHLGMSLEDFGGGCRRRGRAASCQSCSAEAELATLAQPFMRPCQRWRVREARWFTKSPASPVGNAVEFGAPDALGKAVEADYKRQLSVDDSEQ